MLRFVLAHLRGRLGRTVALLLGVVVATTGFTVLTAKTSAARLEVVGTVNRNFRAAYDILVRPAGSRSPLESQRGLVRSNFLSGQYGGISLAQWRRVLAIPGVQVAAPIAMLGYTQADIVTTVDVATALDPAATTQVLKVEPTWIADAGLSRLPDSAPLYVYVTRRPVAWPPGSSDLLANMQQYFNGKPMPYSDGSRHTLRQIEAVCGSPGLPVPFEQQPDGRWLPLCDYLDLSGAGTGDTTDQYRHGYLTVAQWLPDGRFREDAGTPVTGVALGFDWPMALLLAAIDPAQEAKLVGLNQAITAGRYLTGTDVPVPGTSSRLEQVPVLLSGSPYLDERVATAAARVDLARVGTPAGVPFDTLDTRLAAAATGLSHPTGQVTATTAYRAALASPGTVSDLNSGAADSPLMSVFAPVVQSGQPSYTVLPDGSLRPATTQNVATVWQAPHVIGQALPFLIGDTQFRPLIQAMPVSSDGTGLARARPVGVFDAGRLAGFAGLGRVPLETYQAPALSGADAASRRALGGRDLLPDSNAGGYLATPPLMLTDLASIGAITSASAAPVSAIRVRVAGISGFNAVSRERVRLVAQQIAADTGLDVDITMGSSLAPQTIVLAAGKYGRPALRLTELWSKKGVAATIVTAVDRKSLILFVLVLLVCALFLGNAVSAAVRDRRTELAVLACLGWPARRIGAAILGEVGLLGVAAGVVGAVLALPLGGLVGARVSVGHAGLAIPVAVVLALAAGGWPAWRATRAQPLAVVRAAGVSVGRPARRGRGRARRTVAGLAWVNLRRTPGRALLGAAALAVGVCALTLLAAVQWAFHGAVVGSVLGDAVSVQVRGVDEIAVAAMLLLAVVAVADVLYLGIRERGAELAALGAVGWSARALDRLIVFEGLGLGVAGAVAGAAAGLGLAAWLAGALPDALIVTGLAAATAGIVSTLLAATVPAALLRGVPTTTLLAED